MTDAERLAQRFGMDVSKIEKWIAGNDPLQASAECLTLAEIRALPLVTLGRENHIKGCMFCTSLVAAD